MTARPTVVVTRRLPGVVEEELSRDFDVRLNRDDRPLGAAGLQEALRDADALLCTVTDRITAEVLGLHIEDDALAQTLQGTATSQDACAQLLQLALDKGGRDNITIIVAGYHFPA